MSVEAQTVEYVYLGDGASTVFGFPSKFLSGADIVVGLDGQEQVGGYSTTGAGNETGGSVTFTAAPAAGVRVSLLRKPAASQLLDFVNGQTVLEGVLDTGLDKLTMLIQYLLRALQKTVRLSEFDPSAFSTLPFADSRANKLLGFDASGDAVAVVNITDALAISEAVGEAAGSASAAAGSASAAAGSASAAAGSAALLSSLGGIVSAPYSSHNLDIVAGVIRQRTDDRSKWVFLDDSAHTPVGFDGTRELYASDGTTFLAPHSAGVSLVAFFKNRTDALKLDASDTTTYYDRVSAVTVTPDERLTYDYGITLGAQVLRSGIKINGSMHKTRHGRVYWDTVSSTFICEDDGLQPSPNVTASWDSVNGILTVNHDWLPGQDLTLVPDTRYNTALTLWIPVRHTVSDTSFQLRFIIPGTNPGFTMRTGAQGTGMSFRWSKTYNGPVYFDGTNGFDNVPWSETDAGNIWILGVMQR